MGKKINIYGILSNSLLVISLVMSFLHLPNQALLIILGMLLMITVESLLFLFYLNKFHSTKKSYNIIAFISAFLFIPSLFFSMQQFMVPLQIVASITVLSGSFLLYFFINEFKRGRFKYNKISFIHYYISFVILLIINLPFQMQAIDYMYDPYIEKPSYDKDKGPIILVDQGHNNFSTMENRLRAPVTLFEKDGFRVSQLSGKIDINKLKGCKILYIPNALNEKSVEDWVNPTYQAFTKEEIAIIKQWVSDGGSLFLIADHFPFPGAIHDLAYEFGFELENGYAGDTLGLEDRFSRATNTLTDNVISNGRNIKERADSILTFEGHAFRIPDDATSILTFDQNYVQWNFNTVWDYSNIKPYSIKGYSQGAFKKFDKGRVVIYGEAMMFTAQLGAGLSWVKLGMNSKKCPKNYQLLLNTIHWLDGQLD